MNVDSDYCKDLLEQDVQQRFNELNRNSYFRDAPNRQKAVMQELHYTTGISQFPKMVDALKKKDYSLACERAHRKDAGNETMWHRNQEVEKWCAPYKKKEEEW